MSKTGRLATVTPFLNGLEKRWLNPIMSNNTFREEAAQRWLSGALRNKRI
jgi:hypothetical protein